MTTEEQMSIAIERLDATIEKIKTLKPEQFNYDAFVTEGKDGCGTTCCVAGWYPIWFPESKLKWVRSNNNYDTKDTVLLETSVMPFNPTSMDRNYYIIKSLVEYHGLTRKVIKALFTGDGLATVGSDDYILKSIWFCNDSKINDILQRFETVRALLMIGNHNDFLNK